MHKPVSQPCLRNQDPIYQTLKLSFSQPGRVLELACGTGQHAVYLAQRLPHLSWQATDLLAALAASKLWVEEAALANLLPPMELDVASRHWSDEKFDYVFAANLVHFVSMERVKSMFAGIARVLLPGGMLALYGPYNNLGFTSAGNARLDAWLKNDIHPQAGIKELAAVCELASQHKLTLVENHLMPANNHLLLFKHEAI
ncbi:MAG: DUF938 domain-containing protein [Bermanella sp.]